MKSSGIGGQAVIEGVMMRHKEDIAVAVRKPDGSIVVGRKKYNNLTAKNQFFKWPVVRGVVSFVSSLILGISTLMYSASFFEEEEDKNIKNKAEANVKKAEPASETDAPAENEVKAAAGTAAPTEEDIDKKQSSQSKGDSAMMFGTVAISLVVAIAVFFILPLYASKGIMLLLHSDSTVLLAVIEGVLKLGIFIGYIAAISCMKDIKRTFMYHGAEHKCINCVESGKALTVDNVMASSKEHRRCGTSFIFFVLFISIIFFILIRVDTMWLRLIIRLLLIPVIAGVSFEFIQWAGNSDSKAAAILSRPGLWIQGLTTKEPDRDMVQVAIASVEAVFDWKKYLEENFGEGNATDEGKCCGTCGENQ